MKKSMLEYVKIILWKVSFDRQLFIKEYKKSLQWLTSEEVRILKGWIRQHHYTLAPQRLDVHGKVRRPMLQGQPV